MVRSCGSASASHRSIPIFEQDAEPVAAMVGQHARVELVTEEWELALDAGNRVARQHARPAMPGRELVHPAPVGVLAVGVLSASPGLAGAISRYASGAVDPRPLVAAMVGLGEVAEVLAGRRPPGAGAGPKIQVDPSR